MFWGDSIIKDIQERFAQDIALGTELVIRDEKTPSGRVHIGSMRGVAIHGLVAQMLADAGIKHSFVYEFNDSDPMDGLPVYLDKTVFDSYMGMSLNAVPAPEDAAKNFAEFFAADFQSVITEAGYYPLYTRASDLYTSGRMNEAIRLALDNASVIRRIYKEVSGADKPASWFPLSVRCESCKKISTTKVTAWNGSEVSYACYETAVDWTKGCGHTGTVSPFDGRAKLPWKVEWPAKWLAYGVHIEGAGKDHSTKGGARDIANHIVREVFHREPPFDIPYEFFLVGGKKMSSSKGSGSSAREVKDLLPAHIFRLAFYDKKPLSAINFDPSGDTVPVLFDRYDALMQKYWTGEKDDETRMVQFLHDGVPEQYYRMRFSLVSFLVQMPHLSLNAEAEHEKGSPLSAYEKDALDERARYARFWLDTYAPERYVYKLATDAVPASAQSLSDSQKNALRTLAQFVESNEKIDGAMMHAQLHAIKESQGITPKELFSAIYQVFLGRDSGPQAGWFLSVLPREFLITRLKEVIT